MAANTQNTNGNMENSCLNLMMNPSFIVDDSHTITWANTAFMQTFDLKEDDVINKMTCEEACPTQLCGTKDCPVAKSTRIKKAASAETIFKNSDETISYFNAQATPVNGAGSGTFVSLTDITELKQTKAELNQMRTDLNVIPTPIMEIDKNFNVTFMNPAGAGVVDKTPDEVIGEKCYNLFKTPHCKTDKCACARAMQTDSTVTENTIARPKDGVIIPIQYTASPIKDAKGNITGALEYVLDMTEENKQKQAANEKIENLNTIPTPIMSIDTDFSITFMNPAAANVVGSTPDQVIGKKCYDLFKTPHCKTDKCACLRAMKEDAVVTEETIARPAEGVIIPIKYTGAPIKDAKGNIKGALEYVLDQTEENKQKQAANEKIDNLNTIPTPIVSMDTEFNITFMNPAAAGVVGLTPDEAIGKKCYDLFKTPHCKTEKCACARAMKEDKVITEETIARPAEGVIIPIKYTGAPIKDAKGNIKGVLEYVLDMTEENQQKQAANEKIENLNTIPTPIMSIDTEHTITFMNPAGAGVIGLTPDEAVGKKCYDLFKTPHCKTEKCACTRAMKEDAVITEETIARPAEGVIIPIKYTGAPIKDAKGNIKGALEYVLDVTEERKQKHEAEEKIEHLNTIPTPILAIDTDFNITFMNPAGAGALGSTPDQLIGQKCYDLFKTPHCHTEKCACTQAMKTGSVVTEETIARPAEGVVIPIRYTGAPIKDAKGNITGALEFVLDQTEESKQKQAANEKIENLNTIPTPIMSIDTDYNITFMNPAGAGVVGLTPDEAVGKKCYELFKTPHCQTDRCACSRAMKTDSVITEQTIARPQDGVIIPIKYTGAPIKDAKGNIKGALEYVLDMTEEAKQKQAADEKIENLNTIPTPILSIDTDYNITFMNPAGAAVVGSTPDEVIGKKCYDLFKTEHCKTENCACLQAMKTDSVSHGQTVASPNGREMPIKYTGAPIKDAKGNIKGALEYITDVTAEKEVERLIASAVSDVDTLVLSSKDQMDNANGQVDDMNKIIDQAVQQLDESMMTVRTMQESSSEMLTLSTESNEIATNLASEAETGKMAGRDAGQKLADINNSMEKNNEMVNGLVSQLEKISSFVDIIKDIASQTNLLAFNAAIEAARAGDAGRGFAVVADEVRKLAENSSKSAIDISNIVKNVEKESHQTISAMQEGMSMLEEGGTVINTALESMETISKGIVTISDSVDKVSNTAEDLNKNGSELLEKIEIVTDSSKKNQQSTIAVNDSLSETVAALTQLTSSSKELQEAVNNL